MFDTSVKQEYESHINSYQNSLEVVEKLLSDLITASNIKIHTIQGRVKSRETLINSYNYGDGRERARRNGGKDFDREIERRKVSVRSKVEWPHLEVKRIFGYCKCAYKGIKKNLNRFYILFASVNFLKVIWGGRATEFCAVRSR